MPNYSTIAAKARIEKRIPPGLPEGAACAFMLVNNKGEEIARADASGEISFPSGMNASDLGSGTVPDARLRGAIINAVADADSRTDPANPNWFTFLTGQTDYLPTVRGHNYGVSGKTVAQMVSGYSGTGAPSTSVGGGHQFSPAVTGLKGVYFVWGGTNDLNDESTTDTTVLTGLQSLYNSARADGYYPVVGFTETPRTPWEAGKETHRVALNTSLRALTPGASGAPDILIDTAAMFSDATNGDDFPDGLHLSTAAQLRLAAYVRARLNGLAALFGTDIRGAIIKGATITGGTLGGGAILNGISFLGLSVLPGINAADFSNNVDANLAIRISEIGAGDKFAKIGTETSSALVFATNSTERWRINVAGEFVSAAGPKIIAGSGAPESSVTAPVGSIYIRTNGGAGTSFYVKESGTGNTGWTAK